jgi:hypothetical protein
MFLSPGALEQLAEVRRQEAERREADPCRLAR